MCVHVQRARATFVHLARTSHTPVCANIGRYSREKNFMKTSKKRKIVNSASLIGVRVHVIVKCFAQVISPLRMLSYVRVRVCVWCVLYVPLRAHASNGQTFFVCHKNRTWLLWLRSYGKCVEIRLLVTTRRFITIDLRPHIDCVDSWKATVAMMLEQKQFSMLSNAPYPIWSQEMISRIYIYSGSGHLLLSQSVNCARTHTRMR